MPGFERFITRTPRSTACDLDDPTILFLKQRRAHSALKLRESNRMSPEEAYAITQRMPLEELC